MSLILKCHILFLLNFLPIVIRLTSVIQKKPQNPQSCWFLRFFILLTIGNDRQAKQYTFLEKQSLDYCFFSSVLVATVEYSLDDRL